MYSIYCNLGFFCFVLCTYQVMVVWVSEVLVYLKSSSMCWSSWGLARDWLRESWESREARDTRTESRQDLKQGGIWVRNRAEFGSETG